MTTSRNLYFLDMHISSLLDIESTLKWRGVRLEADSLSAHWWLRYLQPPKACFSPALGEIPVYSYNAYEEISVRFAQRSGLSGPGYCYTGFPPYLWHIFARQELPIILNMAHRIDYMIPEWRDFDRFLEKTLNMMDAKKLFVHAASRYDIKYFQYFTGREVPLLPPIFRYLEPLQWDIDRIATDKIYLFNGRDRGGGRQEFTLLYKEYTDWFDQHSNIELYAGPPQSLPGPLQGARNFCTPLALRHLLESMIYPGHSKFLQRYLRAYSHQDLLRYRAIVFFPYSTFSYTMYELLKLGVPLFFPSKRLLKQWQRQYGILHERFNTYLKPPLTGSRSRYA